MPMFICLQDPVSLYFSAFVPYYVCSLVPICPLIPTSRRIAFSLFSLVLSLYSLTHNSLAIYATYFLLWLYSFVPVHDCLSFPELMFPNPYIASSCSHLPLFPFPRFPIPIVHCKYVSMFPCHFPVHIFPTSCFHLSPDTYVSLALCYTVNIVFPSLMFPFFYILPRSGEHYPL